MVRKNKGSVVKSLFIVYLFYFFPTLINAQPTLVATKINGQKVTYNNRELTLKALEDDLIFDYQAVATDSFVFLLDNYDLQPVKTTFPTIRYTHLRGGSYTLNYWTETKGQSSPKGQIKLYVEESLAETWWFYPTIVGCVLILLGVVFYFWSIYDLRQKFKLETIRNQIASDLHDEIGSDLGSIVLSLGTMQRKYGKETLELSHKLEEIKETTRSTAANLRDTVWIIQPNNDSLPQLLDKIKAFALRLLNAIYIELIFDNKIAPNDTFSISMEQRRCVYLMMREAVHNIAKHAQATKVIITITKEKEGIRVIIADNGIGFDPSVVTANGNGLDPLGTGGGNGLKNFKTRSAQCFIDFDLTSTPSVGTTISLLIPEL
jgi:signal transduction histidine kinase